MFLFKSKNKWVKPNIVILFVAVALSFLNSSGIEENQLTLIASTLLAINTSPTAIRVSLLLGICYLFVSTAMAHFKKPALSLRTKGTGIDLLSAALGCIGGWLIASISMTDDYRLIMASITLYMILIIQYWVIPNLHHQFVIKYVEKNKKGNSLMLVSVIAIASLVILDLSKGLII